MIVRVLTSDKSGRQVPASEGARVNIFHDEAVWRVDLTREEAASLIEELHARLQEPVRRRKTVVA